MDAWTSVLYVLNDWDLAAAGAGAEANGTHEGLIANNEAARRYNEGQGRSNGACCGHICSNIQQRSPSNRYRLGDLALEIHFHPGWLLFWSSYTPVLWAESSWQIGRLRVWWLSTPIRFQAGFSES